MEEPEVVVVGAGVNGLAAARALAGSGRRTLVLERFAPGHPRGSSHGASRVFRLSHEDAVEVAEAVRALGLWRRLEQEVGQRLLELRGSIDTGRDLGSHAAALEAEGVRFEIVRAAEVERRFGVSLPAGESALVQPDDLALAALRRSAKERGVRARETPLRPATSLGEVPDGARTRPHSLGHQAPACPGGRG